MPDCEVLLHAPSTLSRIVVGRKRSYIWPANRRFADVETQKRRQRLQALEGTVAMTDVFDTVITDGNDYRGPSAQAWFAVGERVGYDPKSRAIVAAQDAPLKTFLKREGEVSHAVTFLPGYPD